MVDLSGMQKYPGGFRYEFYLPRPAAAKNKGDTMDAASLDVEFRIQYEFKDADMVFNPRDNQMGHPFVRNHGVGTLRGRGGRRRKNELPSLHPLPSHRDHNAIHSHRAFTTN